MINQSDFKTSTPWSSTRKTKPPISAKVRLFQLPTRQAKFDLFLLYIVMQTSLDVHQAKNLSDFLMSLQKENKPISEETPIEPEKLDFFRTITVNYSCVKAKVIHRDYFKQLSKEERSSQQLTSNNFSYGEIVSYLVIEAIRLCLQDIPYTEEEA
jgi:hypothetical protein